MKQEEEKCCGSCCWFKHECMEGYGVCYGRNGKTLGVLPYCGSAPCSDFVSEGEMRHHMAVLIQANRYRRDNHVPAIYRMPNPTELGRAIDFSVEYMKIFGRL